MATLSTGYPTKFTAAHYYSHRVDGVNGKMLSFKYIILAYTHGRPASPGLFVPGLTAYGLVPAMPSDHVLLFPFSRLCLQQTVRRAEVELLSLVTRKSQQRYKVSPFEVNVASGYQLTSWLHCMHHAILRVSTGHFGFVVYAAGPAGIAVCIPSHWLIDLRRRSKVAHHVRSRLMGTFTAIVVIVKYLWSTCYPLFFNVHTCFSNLVAFIARYIDIVKQFVLTSKSTSKSTLKLFSRQSAVPVLSSH